MRISLRESEVDAEEERVREGSVRDEQKPAPSCRLAVDAQEHVSATHPQPQSGLHDPLFTGTSAR